MVVVVVVVVDVVLVVVVEVDVVLVVVVVDVEVDVLAERASSGIEMVAGPCPRFTNPTTILPPARNPVQTSDVPDSVPVLAVDRTCARQSCRNVCTLEVRM